MHLNPRDIADYLQNLPAAHGDEKGPYARMDAECQLNDKDERKDAQIERVACEGRVVLDLSPGGRAGLVGAEVGVVVES